MFTCKKCDGLGTIRGHICQYCNGRGGFPNQLLFLAVLVLFMLIYGLVGLIDVIAKAVISGG